MLSTKSRIFEHVHTVASFCNEVPARVKYDTNLNTVHIITATSNQYNVFSLAKLAKLYVSDLLPAKISFIAAHEFCIACVCDTNIHNCVRGKVVGTYEQHEAKILGVLFIGDFIVSWDVEGELHVFHKVTCHPVIQLTLERKFGKIAQVIHPKTYMNKVLVGFTNGKLQLWNVKSAKLVHDFTCVAILSTELSCICQSPVVDIVGIGYSCGTILMVNVKTDKVLMKFNQNGSKVTALSFRLDDSPVLVCATLDGCIGCWNLNEKSLQSVVYEATDIKHPIAGLECILGQNLMMTSSSANSLKLWIFDSKDGSSPPRVLIERMGHAEGDISHLRMYDNSSGLGYLLTAGADGSVKKLSLEHERHARNLGVSRITSGKTGVRQSTGDVSLGGVTSLCCEVRREADWDSAVTCHLNQDVVCSWSVYKGTIGRHRLKPTLEQKEKEYNIVATCVDLSSCGNFCVIGYSNGLINKFNIQSGDLRASAETSQTSISTNTCVGIAIDKLNTKIVVAKTSNITFHSFEKLKQLGSILKLSEDIESIRLHRENSLMAVSLSDFSIEIVDYVEQKSVRHFSEKSVSCHKAKILDMVLSPDSRWLVSSSLDSTIRVWNIPTCTLIDCFATQHPAVTFDFSPTADVLCVAFMDSIGVAVLSNISLYRPVDLTPLPSDFDPLQIATIAVEIWDDEDDMNKNAKSDVLISNMASLSLNPEGSSKWTTLLKYDTIQERNKPKDPPKVLKSAPFFIPTVAGLEFQLDTEEAKKLLKTDKKSDIVEKVLNEDSSVLVKMMSNQESTKSEDIINFLEAKSVAAINFEIYSLSEAQGGSNQMIRKFIQHLSNCIKSGRSLDGCAAMLQVTLKHHGPTILENADLFLDLFEELKCSHNETWTRIAEQFQLSVAVSSFIRSPLV